MVSAVLFAKDLRKVSTFYVISDPPRRRENGAVRLDFIVDDISRSRSDARSLGGVIDDQPPSWAGGDIRFYLGHDPDGNVFGTTIA
jgi:hypothetical protein